MTHSLVVYTFLSRQEIPIKLGSTSFDITIAWMMKNQVSGYGAVVIGTLVHWYHGLGGGF
jgi:hypothetical protein